MGTLIITEKTSQARDCRRRAWRSLRQDPSRRRPSLAPRRARRGRMRPGRAGPACCSSRTSSTPPGLQTQGNKPAKLKAIEAGAQEPATRSSSPPTATARASSSARRSWSICGYRGSVQRALFTAQDPKTIRQAFAALKPNRELRSLYEAAVARQQADQIYNLSLTRTATKTLLAPGTRGVIGIGRVKTPTLGHRLPARAGNPQFQAGGLFRDRGDGSSPKAALSLSAMLRRRSSASRIAPAPMPSQRPPPSYQRGARRHGRA